MGLRARLPVRAFAFLASLVTLSGSGAVLSTATVTTNHYVFGGTNHAQMRVAMIEARPWKQTMVYDAHTKWDIKSSYRYSRANGEYKLSSAEVMTKVATTLPLWIPGKPVARDLVARWQKCLAGLIVHEQGHLQLARAAGAEVGRRLGELAGFASSEELVAAADRAVKDTIDEFQSRERRYDEVTGHGRTQGAVFPDLVRSDEDFNPALPPPGDSPRRQNTPRR